MLDQLKRLSEEAGRDYESLELTAMTQDTIQRYRDFGVKTLFTVPLSRDPDGIVREVREFATRVQDVS